MAARFRREPGASHCIVRRSRYVHSTRNSPGFAITPPAALLQQGRLPALDEVDGARSALYRLIAHGLAAPPDAGLLARMAGVRGDDRPLGSALNALSTAARAVSVAEARAEYDLLFIGVARGELLPYASFYLTGFLHERPLARLRAEMSRLALGRAAGRSDPEDHMATVCDVMAELIERGDTGAEAGFFARHLAPWAAAFFSDLEVAANARMYRPLGSVGRILVELDRQGFAYADDAPEYITTDRGAA